MLAPALESTISASGNTSSPYPKSKVLSVTSRPPIVTDFKYHPGCAGYVSLIDPIESREIEPAIVVHGEALRSTTTRWTAIDVHRRGVNRLRTHGQTRSALGHEAALECRADRRLDRHRRRVVLADRDVLGAELRARAWTRLGLDLQDVVARRHVRELERTLGSDLHDSRLGRHAARAMAHAERHATDDGIATRVDRRSGDPHRRCHHDRQIDSGDVASEFDLHRLRGLDVRGARVVHRCESRRARTARGGLRRVDRRDDQVRTARQPEQPISTPIVCESWPRREFRNRPLAVVLEPERTHQHALKRLAGAIDDRPRDDAATSEHQLDVVHACVTVDTQPASGSGVWLCARIGHEKPQLGRPDLVVAVLERPRVELAIRIGDDHPRQVASGDVDERIADRLPERRHDPANDRSRLLRRLILRASPVAARGGVIISGSGVDSKSTSPVSSPGRTSTNRVGPWRPGVIPGKIRRRRETIPCTTSRPGTTPGRQGHDLGELPVAMMYVPAGRPPIRYSPASSVSAS